MLQRWQKTARLGRAFAQREVRYSGFYIADGRLLLRSFFPPTHISSTGDIGSKARYNRERGAPTAFITSPRPFNFLIISEWKWGMGLRGGACDRARVILRLRITAYLSFRSDDGFPPPFLSRSSRRNLNAPAISSKRYSRFLRSHPRVNRLPLSERPACVGRRTARDAFSSAFDEPTDTVVRNTRR